MVSWILSESSNSNYQKKIQFLIFLAGFSLIYFRYIILKNIFFFIFIFLFLNACGTSKKESKQPPSGAPTYKIIAEENFHNDYKAEFNNDSTYIIVYYSPKSKLMSLNPPLRFFVYNIILKKLIYRDNLANGEVKWKNSHQFIVTTIPEIVKGNDEENSRAFGYTYDVITGRKLSDLDRNK